MLLSHQRLSCGVVLLAALVTITTEPSTLAQAQPHTALPQTTSVPTPLHAAVDFDSAAAYPVVRVIGANRLVVLIDNTETTIQFAGVDSPNTGALPLEAIETLHTQSNQFLSDLLTGETVFLKDQEVRDGQLLAYVFRAPDGLFVNAEMIRQGLGVAYQSADSRLDDLFRYSQQRARKTERGFWKECSSLALAMEGPAARQRPTSARQPVVYVESCGSSYHAAGCPHLHDDPVPMALYKAVTGFQWCPHCKPAR